MENVKISKTKKYLFRQSEKYELTTNFQNLEDDFQNGDFRRHWRQQYYQNPIHEIFM